jgi:polygalacturonase
MVPIFFNVIDFGAVSDGQTLSTIAIQAALDACSAAGGGTVYFPAGKYVTGSIFLKSQVTLHLESGATLFGSQDPSDYPVIDSRWEGASQLTHAPLIGGRDLQCIGIVGRGVVDGRGVGWWKMQRERTLKYPRPRLISFEDCRNVLVEGITATNSPSWTINPVRCDNVNIDKVTVINPHDSPNTDGINPDSCSNVHISNCYIDVGDDCITIKSGTEQDTKLGLTPCQNITVTNCTMAHGHGGVVIGSEMSGDVRNVVISNCVFIGTDRGIRMKSRRGRGGLVEDIRVSNIVMKDVLCPFTMNLYYGCGAWGDPHVSDKRPHPVDSSTPRFRRIHLSHISAREVKLAAGFIYGLAEMAVEEITLSDIAISMADEAKPGYAEMADGLELMQRGGLFVCNTRGIQLDQVVISNQVGPAFRLIDSGDVELSRCGSLPSPAGTALIQMTNVVGAFVHGCQARPGCEIFLKLEGEQTRAIVLGGNSLTSAGQAFEMSPEVPIEEVSTQ